MIGARRHLTASLCCLAVAAIPSFARAAEVALQDAVNCADFKHNPDGSWYTKGVTVSYGSNGNQRQINYFGPATITSKDGEIFTVLNEKCAAGH
ncbi:MAG: hypothetical protein JO267_16275 [Alphaproteobacteria bacterium]|nr:hypothetical protein [Alphaproteobacteria bacterium]